MQAVRLAVGEGVGVYLDRDLWTKVRRKVLAGELSKRSACRTYKLHWGTLEKMLRNVEPSGYGPGRLTPRPKPVLEKFLPIIHEILEQDRGAPPKPRHTAKRIYFRLPYATFFGYRLHARAAGDGGGRSTPYAANREGTCEPDD